MRKEQYMCGIIGAFNDNKNQKENVNEWVIDTLQNQIDRGEKGFGIIFIDKSLKVIIKRACELTKTMLDLYMNNAKMIILHHRNPTSSANKLSQTHPILVENKSLKYKYYVVHNGIVSNDEDVKKAHKQLGFEYTTEYEKRWFSANSDIKFNDSECIAIELARYIEKKTDTMAIIGSAAFIGLQVDKKTNKALNVYFGRNNGCPLNLAASRGKIRLSSEGQGTAITENFLYSFNLKDFKIKKRKMTIGKEEKIEYIENRFNYHDSYKDYYTRKETENKSEKKSIIKENKIDELIDDTEIEIENILDFFYQQIQDPTSLMMMDSQEAIKETTKEIIFKLNELYNKSIEEMVDNYYFDNTKNTNNKLIEKKHEKNDKKVKENIKENIKKEEIDTFSLVTENLNQYNI